MINFILNRYLFIEFIYPNENFTLKFDDANYTSDHVFPKQMDFGKDHYVKDTFNNTLNEKEFFFIIKIRIIISKKYRSFNYFLDILKLMMNSFLN